MLVPRKISLYVLIYCCEYSSNFQYALTLRQQLTSLSAAPKPTHFSSVCRESHLGEKTTAQKMKVANLHRYIVSHRIHVWYVCLHFLDFDGKYRHTWILLVWLFYAKNHDLNNGFLEESRTKFVVPNFSLAPDF